jgi:hypothetical protein
VVGIVIGIMIAGKIVKRTSVIPGARALGTMTPKNTKIAFYANITSTSGSL